jgi:hypothetical protein
VDGGWIEREEVGMEIKTYRESETYRRTLEAYKQAVDDLAKLAGKCRIEEFEQATAKTEAARKTFEAQRKTRTGRVHFPPR